MTQQITGPTGTFEAFEDVAAYAPTSLTRSQAITEGREANWTLKDDYTRDELRAVRVFMRPVASQEAEEAFFGEYESGWLECAADCPGAVPMWKVEPKPRKPGRGSANDDA